ncbi:MAG: non-heme iron oxygenase ferredoxin subunit [Cellulomonas sp.]|nr:non-heme iron oxygenase ferredoxin subunit [Cellulomonas sp.]
MSDQLACLTADVPVAGTLRVELDGVDGLVEIAIVRDEDGGWHALSDICSHGQVSLSDGDVDGCTVECWLHGSRFDLVTGRPLALPATTAVPVYPVTLDGDRVLVDVDTPLNS